jgi:integrase/recombinase XerD
MPRRPPAPRTLSSAVEEYLAWLELDRHASPNTIDAYRRDLAAFSRFAEGHGMTAVTELDRDLLRAYQRSLSRRPAGARKALSPATRQRHLVSLRSLLRFAAREEWLPGDLGSTIDLPRLPERLPKPLDEADRLTLTEALGGDSQVDRRDRALILFLLSTGCRISEALGLDRQDWGHDRVVVRGKGDRERSVLITENARHAVDEYLAARGDSSPALFVGLQPASKAATDNRLTPQGARFICRRLAGRLGIPPFHPHRLRHTLGTLLQDRIGDARLTAETLGHAGLASVAGYTKISEARRRQALEAAEEAGL